MISPKSLEAIRVLRNMAAEFSYDVYSQRSATTESLDVNILIEEVKRTYTSLKVSSTPCLPKTESLKRALLSIEWRDQGNSSFKKAEYNKALQLYSRSVVCAPEKSEESALAYANRSAVLFRMHEYIPCLLDINRALGGKYPEHLKEKLLNRKRQCLLEIKRMNKEDGIQSTLQLRGDETELGNSNKNGLVTRGRESGRFMCRCKFENPLIPNASSKIRLESNEKWGRFMVAAEDIEPGEILSVQKMFFSFLQVEECHKKCSYCLSECHSLIPCLKCSNYRMYCSTYCRAQAYDLYHRTECRMSQFEGLFGVADFMSMAIKFLLVGTEQGAQLKNLMEKITIHDIFAQNVDPSNKPFVHDYLSYLHLCRTYNLLLLKDFPLFFAVNVIIMLEKLDFFETSSNCQNTLDDTKLFTIMLLMNQTISVLYNRFQMGHGPVLESTAGLCSLHNMINHSCDPNTAMFPDNYEQIMLAVQPIRRGEQIFTSYSSPFPILSLADRQEHLSAYLFECSCQACVERWPLKQDLQKRKVEFVNKNQKQAAIAQFSRTFFQLLKGRKLVNLSDDEIFKVIRTTCAWLHSFVRKPAIEIIWCEEILENFFQWLYDILENKMSRDQMIESVDLALKNIMARCVGAN